MCLQALDRIGSLALVIGFGGITEWVEARVGFLGGWYLVLGLLELVLATAIETFYAGGAGGLLRVFLQNALAVLLLLNGL